MYAIQVETALKRRVVRRITRRSLHALPHGNWLWFRCAEGYAQTSADALVTYAYTLRAAGTLPGRSPGSRTGRLATFQPHRLPTDSKVRSGCRGVRRMQSRFDYRCGGSVGLVTLATHRTSRLTQHLSAAGHLTGESCGPVRRLSRR